MTDRTSEDGWIIWEGGECPVAEGTLVDVKHRDGTEYLTQLAGVLDESYEQDDASRGFAHDWSIDENDNQEGDIIAYRPVSA